MRCLRYHFVILFILLTSQFRWEVLAQEALEPTEVTAGAAADTGASPGTRDELPQVTAESAVDTGTSGERPRRSSLLKSNANLRGDREAGTGRFYAAGFGGAGFSQDADNGRLTNGAGVSADASLDQNPDSFFGGLKLGYEASGYPVADWLLIRPALELESFYLGQDIAITSVGGPAGTTSMDLTMYSATLNPLLRFEFAERIVPYLGGGFGAAFIETSGGTSTVAPAGAVGDTDDIALLLQAIAGLDILITDRFSVFTEYKFLYLSEVNFNLDSPPVKSSQFDTVNQHLISGGIRYKF